MEEYLTAGELFSGVGGFAQGFERAGIETKWACEIDPQARGVYYRHYPETELYCDVVDLEGDAVTPVDIISFGSPCQDLSIAGARKGFEGDRSVLFFEACRIIEEMRDATGLRFPRWAIWENVGGALSSDGSADFGRALDELAELGAVVIEWHVLNSVHFGVPQRRRRVFVIACFDSGADSIGEILPVATRLPWGSGASISARPGAAESTRGGPIAERGVVQGLTKGLGVGGPDALQAQAGWLVPADVGSLGATGNDNREWRVGADEAAAGHVVPVAFSKLHRAANDEDAENWDEADTAPTLNTHDNQSDVRATALIAYSVFPETGSGVDLRATETDASPTLTAAGGEKMSDRGLRILQSNPIDGVGGNPHAQEYEEAEEPQVPPLRNPPRAQEIRGPSGGLDGVLEEEVLQPGVHEPRLLQPSPEEAPPIGVRRLTPSECEALMGFPRDWTRWMANGDELADSPRYRLCGNAVVVPVVQWIGEHLVRCDALLRD